MRPNQYDASARIMKVGKRIAITIVVCVPFLIVFAYLTRNLIKSSAIQIVCFMLIMGIVVLIEELISRKREKIKKETQIERKDVFR